MQMINFHLPFPPPIDVIRFGSRKAPGLLIGQVATDASVQEKLERIIGW